MTVVLLPHSEKSYTGGRYFLGLGHSFITFPTQAVTIDFTADPGARERPLATRTSDGLPVTLQISMRTPLRALFLLDFVLLSATGWVTRQSAEQRCSTSLTGVALLLRRVHPEAGQD